MTVGLDTGLFIRLLEGNEVARQVWSLIRSGDLHAAVSCLSIYELDKQGHKGAVEKGASDALAEELPTLCAVVWLDHPALLRRAARVSHGNGIAMADAIILVSLMEAEAEKIYTTDSDLEAYEGGPEIVVL